MPGVQLLGGHIHETGEGWEGIRDELEHLHRVDLRSQDGASRLTTEVTPQQRNLLKRLKIDPPRKVQKIELGPAGAQTLPRSPQIC